MVRVCWKRVCRMWVLITSHICVLMLITCGEHGFIHTSHAQHRIVRDLDHIDADQQQHPEERAVAGEGGGVFESIGHRGTKR